MGGNFVRLGHYPQDPSVYKACDKLGIIVWDELPWCRGGYGESVWRANTSRLLNEMIDQNYNHPCIAFWSLGNEAGWMPDFENGDNRDTMAMVLNELNDLAHSLDSSRFTAFRKDEVAALIVDVYSPSIWAGWYAGVYKNYENALIDSRYKYKHLLHMEFGGDSHFGRHNEHPITGEGMLRSDTWSESESQLKVESISQKGDYSENYMVDLFDWYLNVSERLDWFAGSAQWSLKDFATPIRPENPIPYMNQKGLVDRAGNPKDAYYVFKSHWAQKLAFVYIESHSWLQRYGKPNASSEVCVFSNCDSVRLWLNGVNQGT